MRQKERKRERGIETGKEKERKTHRDTERGIERKSDERHIECRQTKKAHTHRQTDRHLREEGSVYRLPRATHLLGTIFNSPKTIRPPPPNPINLGIPRTTSNANKVQKNTNELFGSSIHLLSSWFVCMYAISTNVRSHSKMACSWKPTRTLCPKTRAGRPVFEIDLQK